ncbi:MAG TPA: ABC transporter substrate-binding protein [Acetobacteraceae bacterium]|jgi:peptide/nickel transport system substrate-binding protein
MLLSEPIGGGSWVERQVRIGSRWIRRPLIGATMGLAVACFVPPAWAQVLEIATDQSPVGLDPQIATAFSTTMVLSTIYEGLTAIDADLHVVPALAESWTVSPDGLTYTFRLRGNASFHDGRRLSAADVIASVARLRDPKTGSPFASRFAMVDRVESAGDEVRFVLSTPSASFLAQLASLAIVPTNAGDLTKQPDGTGPFRFTEWQPNTFIALERNGAYWQAGRPSLSGLRFEIVPEATTRRLGLSSGTYQFLPAIDAATAAALKDAPGVQVLATQDLAYSLIGMNTSKPPFDQAAVREALNYALDRAQIVQAAYFGAGTPAGPLSPALRDWVLPVTDFPCYRPDAAKAKALLQSAGLTLPVKATVNVLGSLPLVVDLAQIVQSQAGKAGFDLSLNVQEAGRFIQDWRGGNFTAFASLNSGGPDPDDYFGRTFQTGGATNVFKHTDAHLNQLLIEARARQPDRRKALYDQVQRMLACQGPVAHLVYGTLFAAQTAKLHGFRLNPTRSLLGLRDVTLSK